MLGKAMKLKLFAAAAALTLGTLCAAVSAQATTYTYVGSWTLGQGAPWGTNPPVYSGVQAAALLFGGTASDYVTSTVDANPADINFKTWLDGWSDPYTYALNGTPASDTYSLDTGGGGYDSNPGYQSAYSAYVHDHFDGADSAFTNYAFLVTGGGVPEPATWALMLVGAGMAGGALRTARRKAAATA
jgi:hypothetical protein